MKAAPNILTVGVNVFVIGLIMHAHTLKWDCRDLWSDIFSVLSKNSLEALRFSPTDPLKERTRAKRGIKQTFICLIFGEGYNQGALWMDFVFLFFNRYSMQDMNEQRV